MVIANFVFLKGAHMAQAKKGDTVKVSYTGTLDDGTVFDSSEGSEPIEFTIGSGEVIPGFENAIVGLNISDSKKVSIPSVEAYGEYIDELLVEVSKEQLPPNFDPEVGQQVEISQEDGQSLVMTIVEIKDTTIVLDGNHPLAGENLTFDLKLESIG